VGSVGIGSAAVRVDVCGSYGPFVLGLFNEPVPQQNCNTLGRVLFGKPMRSSAGVVALGLGLGVASLVAVTSTACGPARTTTLIDTLTVSDTCSRCEIALERIAVLGGADLPFEFGNTTSLALMSDGRYLAKPLLEGELAIFDAAGRFERIVGREGEGPGEFRSIREVATGPGDTVYVLESGGLVTRLGPDLRYIDRIILERAKPNGWTVLPSGEIAVVSVPLGTRAPPDRVHVINGDGSVRTSFARAPRNYDPIADYNETAGVLSPSRRYGGVWFSKWNEYVLQLFVDGQPRKVLARDVDWFRPWEGVEEERNAPRRPTLEAVAERDDGLLTVVATVADANWEQARGAIVQEFGAGERRADALPRRLMWDSVVEIIDPEAGAILAAARSDDYLRLPVGGDGTLLYAAREDDIGRYRIFVYRVVFAQPLPSS
jgi:6-bladed beta-propeller